MGERTVRVCPPSQPEMNLRRLAESDLPSSVLFTQIDVVTSVYLNRKSVDSLIILVKISEDTRSHYKLMNSGVLRKAYDQTKINEGSREAQWATMLCINVSPFSYPPRLPNVVGIIKSLKLDRTNISTSRVWRHYLFSIVCLSRYAIYRDMLASYVPIAIQLFPFQHLSEDPYIPMTTIALAYLNKEAKYKPQIQAAVRCGVFNQAVCVRDVDGELCGLSLFMDDSVNVVDANHRTPISYAFRKSEDIALSLLRKGANMPSEHVFSACLNGDYLELFKIVIRTKCLGLPYDAVVTEDALKKTAYDIFKRHNSELGPKMCRFFIGAGITDREAVTEPVRRGRMDLFVNFLMAFHPRLGAESIVPQLPLDITQHIATFLVGTKNGRVPGSTAES